VEWKIGGLVMLIEKIEKITKIAAYKGASKEIICKLVFVRAKAKLKIASNTVDWAKRELELAGFFDKDSDYGGMLGHSILDVVKKFCEQGNSGSSAAISLSVLDKLLRHEPLTSLGNPTETGEYEDCTEMGGGNPLWQSTRDPSVFSYDNGKSWEKLANADIPFHAEPYLYYIIEDKKPMYYLDGFGYGESKEFVKRKVTYQEPVPVNGTFIKVFQDVYWIPTEWLGPFKDEKDAVEKAYKYLVYNKYPVSDRLIPRVCHKN